MKALALTLALAVTACEPPPPASPQAPFIPGDGPEQKLSSSLVLDSSLVVFLHINYDLDWDGLMAYGMGSLDVARRQVGQVSQMVCPNIWVLVCHDPDCHEVEAQYASVPAFSRNMQAQSHFPHILEVKSCDYQIRKDGLPYSTPIPVAKGVNYVWTGFRCPSGQYSGGGNTGLQHGTISYFGSATAILQLGGVSGPFGDKEGWRSRANGCAGLPLNDDAWNAPFGLEIQWCQGIGPGTPCLPGSRMFLNATW